MASNGHIALVVDGTSFKDRLSRAENVLCYPQCLVDVSGGRAFHDNFVTLAKRSCHFAELLVDVVIVVARVDQGPIGQVDLAYIFLIPWLASYEKSRRPNS